MTDNRNGGALLEVVIALTLFSVVLTSLAAFSLQITANNRRISLGTQRVAATEQTFNRLASIPFDSLNAAAGCTNITTGAYGREECLTVTNVNANVKRLRLVVTPHSPLLKADTTIFERGRPPRGNPLNVQ